MRKLGQFKKDTTIRKAHNPYLFNRSDLRKKTTIRFSKSVPKLLNHNSLPQTRFIHRSHNIKKQIKVLHEGAMININGHVLLRIRSSHVKGWELKVYFALTSILVIEVLLHSLIFTGAGIDPDVTEYVRPGNVRSR